MERDAFLEKLRERLAIDVPPSLPHPMVPVDGVPLVRYEQPLDDPVEAFERNAKLAGAGVLHGPLDDIVRRAVAETAATSVALSRDDEAVDALVVIDRLGLKSDGPAADATLGVVGAEWGIAATGTVVFSAHRAETRRASLLPPAILVLLRRDHIVRDAGEIFRSMHDRFRSGLPSQLVFATGPSKTGDIEQILTTGVHGPGTVWVGLL